MGAGRGERAFQRPAERAERRLGCRPRPPREAGRDEHPVVGKGEGRTARVQLAPAAMGQQLAAPLPHARHRPAGVRARGRPRVRRRPEPGARPVQDLDGAARGRGIGQRARERPQGLGVDAGKGRQFEHEAGAGGVDVEFARFRPRPATAAANGEAPASRAATTDRALPAPRTVRAGGRSRHSPSRPAPAPTRTCDRLAVQAVRRRRRARSRCGRRPPRCGERQMVPVRPEGPGFQLRIRWQDRRQRSATAPCRSLARSSSARHRPAKNQPRRRCPAFRTAARARRRDRNRNLLRRAAPPARAGRRAPGRAARGSSSRPPARHRGPTRPAEPPDRRWRRCRRFRPGRAGTATNYRHWSPNSRRARAPPARSSPARVVSESHFESYQFPP